MTTPTPLPLDAAEKVKKAREELSGLCSGERKFTMRVPVDRERDTDMVISDALDVAEALAARVAELEKERDEARERADAYAVAVDEADHRGMAWMAHANALRDVLVKSRDLLCEDGDWLPGTSRAHECTTAALIAHPAASLAAHDAEVVEPYKAALLAWQDADHEGENPSDDGARWDGLRELARSLTTAALAAHPAASLAAYRAEVLELAIAEITNRCVRQLGESRLIPGYNRCMDDVDRAIERIRALAAQAQEVTK